MVQALLHSRSRRRFIQAGLVGSIMLAGAGGAWRLLRPSDAPAAAEFRLDAEARAALMAIVPVMIKGAVQVADIPIAVDRVEHAVGTLTLATQKEVQDLFALLTLAPARRFLAGVSPDWPQASEEQIAAFLQGWRLSRFALLQSAYQALHDLITGAWYADESTWAAIGYPGPMPELS